MTSVLPGARPVTASALMARDLDAGPHTIHGFARYNPLIPARHRATIAGIALAIENSHRPGGVPIVAVHLIGHADRDLTRERQDPGYAHRISADRARRVARAVKARLRGDLGSRVEFHVAAAGARRPVVANPRTEADRQRNRRVEITLARRRPGPPPRPATLKLRIDLPGASQKPLSIEPGNFPAVPPIMPTVPVKATAFVNGRASTTVPITWQFQVSGTYIRRAPDDQHAASERYSYDMGTAITSSGDTDFIDLGLLRPGLIVGGSLRITAKATAGSSRASAARTLKIVGKNPSLDDLAGMLRALGSQGMCGNDAWALLRVFKQESNHEQFRQNGAPKIGPPAGVGIVQRDPVTAEWRFPRDRRGTPNNFFPKIYWDWQANVVEGISLFRGAKLGAARRALAALQREAARLHRPLPSPCPGIVMRATIRAYNGGTEYRRINGPPGRSLYQVHPRTRADQVHYVNSVLGFTFPSDPIPPAFQGIFSQTWGAPSDLPCPPCP